MIEIAKENCVGCGSCTNVCPTGAIKMEPDNEGFCYPSVRADRCIGCNACISHCPVYSGEAAWYGVIDFLEVYAGWALDPVGRMSGSSGGIFGEIAKKILAQGGYVTGAVFTEPTIVGCGF